MEEAKAQVEAEHSRIKARWNVKSAIVLGISKVNVPSGKKKKQTMLMKKKRCC